MSQIVRTKREWGLSILSLLIWAGVVGLLSLFFGPNILQNPFIIALLIFLFCFILCWIFGYIHPVRWIKKKELQKKYGYVTKGPGITTQPPPREIIHEVKQFNCPHCGTLQDQGTKFCTKCGQNIE